MRISDWSSDVCSSDLCQGYSEPGAGSDLANFKTSAHIENGEFVVNGQKIWTSTAKQADMIFCLVRTEPDAPKHGGISYLIFRSEEHTSELQSLMRISYAVFCLKKKTRY